MIDGNTINNRDRISIMVQKKSSFNEDLNIPFNPKERKLSILA